MRLLIVGAGATGGYFGGRLFEAGRDVTFLLRPKRAEQIRREGLKIVSSFGNAELRVPVVTADELKQPFDAVLLTVKSFALEQALADLAPAVGGETMLVPVLNGMRHIEAMVERFGEDRVVGGVCKIAAMLDPEGRVVQLARFQELAYGERDGSESKRTQALDAFMQNAGFDARLSNTIMREMWEKWVMLASLGGITCLMRGTIGEVEAAAGGADFARAFLDECLAVATAAGETPTQAALDMTRTMLTTSGSKQTSSMYRDMQQGYQIEADHIIGDLLARATRFGVTAPLLAAAYTHLSVYQNRL